MSARLELALDRLTSGDWRRFEKFASSFLVDEFPNLADMSADSGDGGRDAELLTQIDDPTQFLQYSVTNDWDTKIRDTVKRLKKTKPDAQVLIYVSPKRIGAEADTLKKEIRKEYRIHLEIRDKHYFATRFGVSNATRLASETLAAEIVDPYLASKEIIRTTNVSLSPEEVKAVHVFLMLQLKDDTPEKGLTKLSFEAIIRSILARTNADNRILRSDLLAAARRVLSSLDARRVDELTSAALARLARRQVVRLHTKDDSVCLSYEESTRVKEHLAECDLDECELNEQIKIVIKEEFRGDEWSNDELETIMPRVKRILERCLYARAENFASAVLNGKVSEFATDHLKGLILQDLNANRAKKGSQDGDPMFLNDAIVRILSNSGAHVYRYLKGQADACTLMAFLNSTPDVQAAMTKIFSHGEIWLDTTVILPMLAEELLEPHEGRIQRILAMTRKSGGELFSTTGVLEELASHIHRAMVFTRIPADKWEGGIPFIFEAYVRLGRDPNEFSKWVELMMGDVRPAEDLGAYIEEQFGIKTKDLSDELDHADPTLRATLDNIWLERHEERRRRQKQIEKGRALDPLTVLRLAKHDTESYLGVVQRRNIEPSSPLGYRCWWLTFDSLAPRIGEELRKCGIEPPSSPVLSIDFLSQYLSLGPARVRISKHEIQQLPLGLEPRLVAFLTPELLNEAKSIRLSLSGMPERIVARRVRDHLDVERRKMGPMAQLGTRNFFDEIDDIIPQD